MTFRERTAWIALLSTAVIYGAYFRAAPAGILDFARLSATIVALVVVQVVLIIVMAIFSPKDAQAPRDERDQLIDLRANRIAYYVLASGVVLACLAGAIALPFALTPNTLLFVLVIAELLRLGAQIVQYRLSA